MNRKQRRELARRNKQPMTHAQQDPVNAAMLREINKQILIADRKYSVNFSAVVLWTLHEEFGFGSARLRRMWDGYARQHKQLRDYYESSEDVPFACVEKLKGIGVDVFAWDALDNEE